MNTLANATESKVNGNSSDTPAEVIAPDPPAIMSIKEQFGLNVEEKQNIAKNQDAAAALTNPVIAAPLIAAALSSMEGCDQVSTAMDDIVNAMVHIGGSFQYKAKRYELAKIYEEKLTDFRLHVRKLNLWLESRIRDFEISEQQRRQQIAKAAAEGRSFILSTSTFFSKEEQNMLQEVVRKHLIETTKTATPYLKKKHKAGSNVLCKLIRTECVPRVIQVYMQVPGLFEMIPESIDEKYGPALYFDDDVVVTNKTKQDTATVNSKLQPVAKEPMSSSTSSQIKD